MRRRHSIHAIATLALATTLIGAGTDASHADRAEAAHPGASCAALGNYPAGARAAAAAAAVAQGHTTQGHTTQGYDTQRYSAQGYSTLWHSPRLAPHIGIQPPPSPWRWDGNIIITAYSGCGQPTAGTFSLHGLLMGTPVQSGGRTVIMLCATSCLGPVLADVTATGTFAQDGAHAHDVTYVSVSAALTTTRGGRRSHAALSHITGYLQVTPGQVAILSFFPPPSVSFLPADVAAIGTLPVAVWVYAWRGM